MCQGLDLQHPPPEPIEWIARNKKTGLELGRVMTRLWFDARKIASVKTGLAPEEIEVIAT